MKKKGNLNDYFELGNTNEDNLKKIETLNVLSIKKIYLETFTKKVSEEVKYTHSFKIKVSHNLIKLNSGKEISFEEYKNNLAIFKLSKKEINYKNIVLDGNDMYYSYLDENTIIENEMISNFNNFSKHIYSPLLKEDDNSSNLGIKISPDKLNIGEKIFVENIKNYIDEKFINNKNLDFYLLRNVESLRSIGIYLENDEHPFFPDFILWIIDNKNNITYINFIDPKGQDGIFDRNSGNFNDKATIGNKNIDNTLKNIEENFSNQKSKKIIVNSFIILKPGSDIGKNNRDNIQNKMFKNNIYKIDWIGENKLEGKSYLDLMFQEIGINK